MSTPSAQIRALFAVVLMLIAAACGGGSSPQGSGSAQSAGGDGALIMSLPDGLIEYNLSNGGTRVLIAAAPNTFLLDPALSPDGERIAYIVQPPPKIEGTRYDAGADLWVANRDGSEPRLVFEHVQPNQLVRFPQWESDDAILAIVQETVPRNGITTVEYTLERVRLGAAEGNKPLASGERDKLIVNALTVGISPDRKRAVFAALAPQTGETLKVFDIGTGEASELVGYDQNLAPFVSPRYSPSGASIAFASADQTGVRAPALLAAAGARAPLPAPRGDGLPEDIWLIDAAGGQPRRIADLKEDLPALTWGKDDNHIYVLGAAGLYDIDTRTGAFTRIGEGAFHGQLTWVP